MYVNNVKECPDLVRSAFNEIYSQDETEEGREWITQELMLCSTLEEGESALRNLALWVENAFASLAMADYPWPSPYGSDLPAYPIDVSCSTMAGSTDRSLTYRLGQAVGVEYNSTHDISCFNISEEYYPCADITGYLLIRI